MAHLSGEAGLTETFSTEANEQLNLSWARDCLRGVVDDARKAGYTSTLLGRRRYLPELDSSNRKVREAAERAALTMLIQGGAADIINVAMINVDKAIKGAGLNSRLLLQVDSELVFEVAAGERDVLAAHVCEHMGSAYPLHMPLEVSIGYGPNWGTAALTR
jgi:DNA polymerase-1